MTKNILVLELPFKPNSSASSWHHDPRWENLSWTLLHMGDQAGAEIISHGQSSLSNMPYADHAIALIAGPDVLSIELKLPLASSKKIEAALPLLLEDHLLKSTSEYYFQILPPEDNSPALIRQVAVMDNSWHRLILGQLEDLLTPSLQIIPKTVLIPVGTLARETHTNSDQVSVHFRQAPLNWTSWHENQSSDNSLNQLAQDFFKTHQTADVNFDFFIDVLKKSTKLPSINLLGEPRKKKLRAHVNATSTNLSQIWQPTYRWFAYLAVSSLACWNLYFLFVLGLNQIWYQRIDQLAQSQLQQPSDQPVTTLYQQLAFKLHQNGLKAPTDLDTLSGLSQDMLKQIGPYQVESISYKNHVLELSLNQDIDSKKLTGIAKKLNLKVDFLSNKTIRVSRY